MNITENPDALQLADIVEQSECWTAYKAAAELRRQHARIAEMEDDLQFVERWAVHHGSKPSISAEEALSCIQHYPAIHEITKSYKDGKRPDTFNPYARIADLEAQLSAIGAGGVEPLRKIASAQADVSITVEEWSAVCRQFFIWHGRAPLIDDPDFFNGIARLAVEKSATQPAAQGLDAETRRHAAIGKAIERACADLPEETGIIVSLEKDAGTVTLIDQDGNEHENFSTDYGFAGVLNEAIDTAIAAQAKKGGDINA